MAHFFVFSFTSGIMKYLNSNEAIISYFALFQCFAVVHYDASCSVLTRESVCKFQTLCEVSLSEDECMAMDLSMSLPASSGLFAAPI